MSKKQQFILVHQTPDSKNARNTNIYASGYYDLKTMDHTITQVAYASHQELSERYQQFISLENSVFNPIVHQHAIINLTAHKIKKQHLACRPDYSYLPGEDSDKSLMKPQQIILAKTRSVRCYISC